MFELRLGALLGKSIGEIRALPAPEYRKWELYYLVEPWGWHNTEYLTAKIEAALFEIATKGKKSFTPKQFMRDLTNVNVTPSPEEIAEYRKTHRDELIAAAKRDMGIK
jgi:hypothetical protein